MKLYDAIERLLNLPQETWRACRNFDFAVKYLAASTPQPQLHPNALRVATETTMSLLEADEFLKMMDKLGG